MSADGHVPRNEMQDMVSLSSPAAEAANPPWVRTFRAYVGPGSIHFAWRDGMLRLSAIDIARLIGRQRDVKRLLRKAPAEDLSTYQTTLSPHPLVFVTDFGAMHLLHRVRHANRAKLEVWVVRQAEMLASIFRDFDANVDATILKAAETAVPQFAASARYCSVLRNLIDPALSSAN